MRLVCQSDCSTMWQMQENYPAQANPPSQLFKGEYVQVRGRNTKQMGQAGHIGTKVEYGPRLARPQARLRGLLVPRRGAGRGEQGGL